MNDTLKLPLRVQRTGAGITVTDRDNVWIAEVWKATGDDHLLDKAMRLVDCINGIEGLDGVSADVAFGLVGDLLRRVHAAADGTEEGPGSSWHDLPERIYAIKAERDRWQARAMQCRHLLALVEDDIRDDTLGLVRDVLGTLADQQKGLAPEV